MKSKIILISICLFFITNVFSQEVYYYAKGQKHFLTNISKKRILVGFIDDLSIYEKNDVIKEANNKVRYDIINELSYDKQQSSNDSYIMNLSSYSKKVDIITLIETLRKNKNVKYANYYYYKNKDGGEMHSFYDKVLIRLKSSTTIHDIETLSYKYHFTFEKRPYRTDAYALIITKETKMNAAELSCVLWETGLFTNSQPAIKSILKCNSTYKNKPKYNVNDPKFNSQWGLKSNYMNITGAWDYTKGSSNVKIAVLDVGVDLDHPDLIDNFLKDNDGNVIGYDVYNQTGVTPGSYSQNIDKHGTQCAGCFGAKGDNNKGIAGVSYNSKIIPIRVAKIVDENTGELDLDWSLAGDALVWAAFDNNTKADVISISFGMNDDWDLDFYQDCNSVNYNGRGYRGLPIIVASGNSNNQPYQIDFPADISTTIAVGALNKNKERAVFSDYGTFLDIVAPGVGITTTDIDGGYTDSNPIDGTSFSAPYVAGILGLMYSVNSELTYNEVKESLLKNCIKPKDYSYEDKPFGLWNEEVGYGYPDANAIMTELSSGTGNLNISISHTQNHDNPKKFSFTATCDNGGDNLTFFWTINTVEGDLSKACHYTEEGCVSTSSNPTNEIIFPDYGYYYINVFVYDENGNYGETHEILYIPEHENDECVIVNWVAPSNEECKEAYYITGEEYNLSSHIGIVSCPIYPNSFQYYSGIKAIEWKLNDERIYFREASDLTWDWETSQCFNTIDDFSIGENTISLTVWAGYRPNPDYYTIDYVNKDNAYTIISKKVKVVNPNSYTPLSYYFWHRFLKRNSKIYSSNIKLGDKNYTILLYGEGDEFVNISRDFRANYSTIINHEVIIKPTGDNVFYCGTLPIPEQCSCLDKEMVASYGPNPSDIRYANNYNYEDKCNSGNRTKGNTFVIESPQNYKMSSVDINTNLQGDFEVLPNPFENSFELFFSENIKAERYEIINSSGELIYSKKLFNEIRKSVNGKDFPSGVYFVRLYTNNKIMYKKIVKY